MPLAYWLKPLQKHMCHLNKIGILAPSVEHAVLIDLIEM